MSPAEFKRIRENLGLSQAELAKVLGLSGRNPITLYEMGRRKPSLLICAVMTLLDELPKDRSQELRKKLETQIEKLRKTKRRSSRVTKT